VNTVALDPRSLVFKRGPKAGQPQVVVDEETGCWIWQGGKSRGYGSISDNGKSRGAHVVVYESVFGPVSPGYELGHTCHRRSCVNPIHVEQVTRDQNNSDRYRLPKLSGPVRLEVEELLLAGYPNGYIAKRYGVSIWAVRQLTREINWRDQYSLDIEGIPF
jgi:hypothetical protein